MATWDWLTGDSSEARQARRERRAREAAEAQLRAEEHAAWLRSLSPEQRALYDLGVEVNGLRRSLSNLESELDSERSRRHWLESRLSDLERR